jgi:hypothetical protein
VSKEEEEEEEDEDEDKEITPLRLSHPKQSQFFLH